MLVGTTRSSLFAVQISLQHRSFEVTKKQQNNRRMSRFCWDSLLLCCILLVGFSAVIVGDEGGDYLDSKEAQVVELSNQASINYNRRCELLATCNPSNCSHSVCKPLQGDLEGLTCTTVKDNTFCPAPENGITPCTSMNLDYRRGHVSVYGPGQCGYNACHLFPEGAGSFDEVVHIDQPIGFHSIVLRINGWVVESTSRIGNILKPF